MSAHSIARPRGPATVRLFTEVRGRPVPRGPYPRSRKVRDLEVRQGPAAAEQLQAANTTYGFSSPGALCRRLRVVGGIGVGGWIWAFGGCLRRRLAGAFPTSGCTGSPLIRRASAWALRPSFRWQRRYVGVARENHARPLGNVLPARAGRGSPQPPGWLWLPVS